jgi:alpha-L-arabinofuranosidase
MKKIIIPVLALIAFNTYAETTQNGTETPVAIEIKHTSLTTKKGEIEVKTDGKTVSVSKAPESPLINTVTTTQKTLKAPEAKNSTKEIQSEPVKKPVVIYQASEIMPELSQADLDYIKAVNSNDKINSIESKIVNNEVISKEELKILRQKTLTIDNLFPSQSL